MASRPGLIGGGGGGDDDNNAEDDEEMFQDGDIIDSHFKVLKRLGRGGYGEIYSCDVVKPLSSSSAELSIVAVKVERVSKPGNLLEEESILRALRHCAHVPHLVAAGRHEERINYIAMELLGENLSILRRKQASHRFSVITTCALGMQMVRALREVHDAGFLHRDIKPGNFVMGTRESGNPRAVVLIDYGLSRRHLKADGTPKPKRQMARWVGSRRYMSLNTHLRKDQGRRDDLYSLLYVLIECLTGTLPWAHLRGLQNLDKVRDMKLQYNNEKLVRGLPDQFLQWLNHIRQLRYEDKPDYDLLHNLLKQLLVSNSGSPTTPYDWESSDDPDVKKFSFIPGEGTSDTEKRSLAFAKGYERRGGMEEEESSSEEEEETDGAPPLRPTVSIGSGNMMRNNHSGSQSDKKKSKCTIL